MWRRLQVNEIILKHIHEPLLIFANDQKAIDPRDGLMLFGPYHHTKIKGIRNIGIIGPVPLRSQFIKYLKKIHGPVSNSVREIARPNFPGLETVFGISINFDNIIQLDVDEKNINTYLKYTDSNQRVYNWVGLYTDKLLSYSSTEEMAVDMWFVVIPECIFNYGRPKQRIPLSSDNIRIGLRKNERDTDESFLFEEMQDEHDYLNTAYHFEVNFHNQLKARVLPEKIVTQIIRIEKIAYEDYLPQEKIIEEQKFDANKAWNIGTALYYKLGGLPWILSDIRSGVCYLGLVYKKINTDPSNKNACCAAQMFLKSGDGMVFKGTNGDWWNQETHEFHLSKDAAINVINQCLNSYYQKFNKYPNEIFIHAKTFFDDIEWSGFEEATRDKSKIIGVRIRSNTAFKLYKYGKYCVPRGTMFQYGQNKSFLWSNGFIPRFKTQIGLETPNPLDIIITRGNADIEIVSRDILSLTKLNYNSCMYGVGQPVTLKFADAIGEILTSGKNIQSDVLPFKHYI
jgi:hypothetical protein